MKKITDRQEALDAVRKDGMNLRLISWELQEDKELVLEAIKNNPHSLQFADDSLQNDDELLSYVTKDTRYYWDMINNDGNRYDIPMLNSGEPNYYYKYVNYMKIKDQSPDTFEKMLRWD